MKKNFKIALAAAVVFMVSGFDASAQKFGFIDQEVLLQSMPEMDTVRSKFEKFSKELQDTFNVMNQEFNKKVEEFYSMDESTNEALRQVKQEEMQTLQDRIIQYRDNVPQNQQAEWSRLMQPVIKKATDAIQKVSKAGGFTAVFDVSSGALAFYDETAMTDVTPLVQKELGITPK